jgi:hypothetical protein
MKAIVVCSRYGPAQLGIQARQSLVSIAHDTNPGHHSPVLPTSPPAAVRNSPACVLISAATTKDPSPAAKTKVR